MSILFFLIAALAIGSSLAMITRQEPVHSALFLVLSFCSLSVLYFMLGAPFIGVLQVIVYAGAIMVLFLFVIMLLAAERRTITEEDPLPGVRTFGIGFSALFLAMIAMVALSGAPRGAVGPQSMDELIAGNTQAIGNQLFTTYLMPFEVTSILLLAAMVGAILLAQRRLD